MNLSNFTLLSCPIVLATLVLVSNPAAASPLSYLQGNTEAFTTDHHVISMTANAPSDRPLIPTGCSCARCTKAEKLLQGQFPAF